MWAEFLGDVPPNPHLLWIHQDARPGDLHPFSGVTESLHCILYRQETFSLAGPGLYKLGRAVITVVMNITVGLRFYGGCIICFANLSWADWISLPFFFNISRFWNWKNKIFHSWEKRISLGNEPRWHTQTVHFLHWNQVGPVCTLAARTSSVSCTWGCGKKRGRSWGSVISGGHWQGGWHLSRHSRVWLRVIIPFMEHLLCQVDGKVKCGKYAIVIRSVVVEVRLELQSCCWVAVEHEHVLWASVSSSIKQRQW